MRRIGWQLPLAFLLGALAVWSIGHVVAAIPALYLAAVAPELTRVDLAEHRLPNRLVVPGLVVGLAAAAGSWATTGGVPLVPLIAGLVFGGQLLLLSLAGGIGMGDVKLAAVIGLASPTVQIALGAPVVAFLLGGVVGLGVLIARGRGTRIAFGPFLLVGYFLAVALVPLIPAPPA
jgi:leader peptidase (prepilin peptidase)/N-methyltransferase